MKALEIYLKYHTVIPTENGALQIVILRILLITFEYCIELLAVKFAVSYSIQKTLMANFQKLPHF